MHHDLGSFIRELENLGELRRITEPVSPVLEITRFMEAERVTPAASLPSAAARAADPRWHDRGGHALLFENVVGSDMPLLINAFGSYRRMELALGCDGTGFAAIAERIGNLVKPQPPRTLAEAVDKAKQFAPLLRISPKRIRGRGPCQEIVRTGRDIDLTRLPIIRCWPHDGDYAALGYPADVNANVDGLGHPDIDPARWQAEYAGRYITLASIHTIHAGDAGKPRPSSHNIGMYRVQLLGRDRVAMHWHMHHDGAAHWRSWKRAGKPMPVAIALGGPSVLPYAATCPLPPGISELLMAGFLGKAGMRLCKALTVDLSVPADAEIIIEGLVRTDAGFPGFDPRSPEAGELGPGAVFEGPFGDHTGFYSMPDRYPIVEVTAITQRKNAVYPTTIVGLPPQEDYYLGKATERIMLPLLKTLTHDIVDYDLPLFGAFHNCAFVQIHKDFPLQARRVANAVWGAGQMAWTKMVVVVDHDVNVHDTHAVLAAAARLADPARDLIVQHGPLDILDHAAPWLGAGGKLAIDATRKWPDEAILATPRAQVASLTPEIARNWQAALAAVPGVAAAAAPSTALGWCFVATTARGATDVRAVASRCLAAICDGPISPTFLVFVDASVDVADTDQAMFHLCANADFARDMRTMHADNSRSLALIDATPKASDSGYTLPVRAWPPILEL